MPSVINWFGGDPDVLINYLLGLITIVLYAKDKFNTPTYDKESMGPFSHLPPQLLTIDSRYRQGLRIYILLLLALYTALCIIGPSTFQNVQLGFAASTAQLWPVASATFLISTGAAKDSSILGRIEHFVRQYAQRSAYIPKIVSNLAYSIRNVETTPWLKENRDKLKSAEFDERKAALTALIGSTLVARINENPGQQGHLAAWARANIVFHCMQQMFRGVLPSEKLGQIIEVQENVAVLERLKEQRKELEGRLLRAEEHRAGGTGSGAELDMDKLLSDTQRFSKEVSLTIIVLLSQSVRTFSDLKGRLEQLGFRGIELRDNSDHLVYVVMVNFCILLGAFIAYAVASTPYIFDLVRSLVRSVPNTNLLNDFIVTDRSGVLLTLAAGSLIYMIVFKVIDYLREEYLDVSEWQENLQGYVMVVAMASVCSAIISILLMVLVLSPIGLLQYMWEDPIGLVHQFLFQLLVAGVAAGFAVTYLCDAIKVRWMIGHESTDWLEKKSEAEKRGGEGTKERKAERESVGEIIFQEFFRFNGWADVKKIVHGVIAALLVGALTHATIINKRNNRIEKAKSNIDTLLMSFDQNEGWLAQKVRAARDGAADPGFSNYVSLRWEHLTDITCKLRTMHAAVNAFEAGKKELQLDPEFFKPANGPASNPSRGADNVVKCPEAKKATIESQIEELTQICENLNRMGMPQTPKGGTSSLGALPGPGQPQTGQRIIVPTLFLAPERCELSKSSTSDPGEQSFRGLGSSLGELLYTLKGLDQFSKDTGLAAVAFPMVSGFFIAYMFGAGCRIWRAWWLNNEAGQQEVQKLKEQIERIYNKPVDEGRYREWLTSSLNAINGVAPLEAIRYEGSKVRLYAKIEGEQLDLAGIIIDR